jgi:hypothetical protein
MGQRMQAVLVEEPPLWEFRGGHFFVTCEQSGICRAYPPNVFFRTFAGMAEVAKEYKFGGAEIVQFADHAASS